MPRSRVDAALNAHRKGQEPPTSVKFERPDMPLTSQMVEAFLLVYLKDRLDAPVDTPDFHREVWALCVSPATHIAIAAPRGHAKSSAVTLAYLLVMLLFRQRDFAVIVSDTWGQSVEFLRDLKAELLENDGIIKDFETKRALKDAEDDVIFQMRDGYKFRVVARGSEQKVRGLKWNNRRPNLVIGDDLEGDEQVESKLRRDKFFKWFMKALLPCGSDDCLFRVVGTILHFDSALERLMKDKTWVTRRYTAHKSFDDFSGILWKEKFNEQRLRDIRDRYIGQGEADSYSCEYLNNPIAEGNAYFRREDLLPLSDETRKKITDGKMQLLYYAGWDFAISKTERSDYTVGVVIGAASDGKKYLLDCRRGRWDANEIIEEMFSVQVAWSPSCHFVETGVIEKSLGPFLYTEMAKPDRKYMNLVKITSTKDKMTRARPLQAMTKAHHVVVDKDLGIWGDIEEEFTRFPKGQHDDIVDATSIIGQGLQDVHLGDSEEEIEEDEYEEKKRDFAVGRSEVTGW